MTCLYQPLHYSQLATSLTKASESICDFLGISEKLSALNAIEQGSCKQAHFDLIGDDWDIKKQIQITLKSLNITSELNAYCDTLSGGQLVLLKLYKLFESEAKILLLDEPSNHFDAEGRNWLVQKIKFRWSDTFSKSRQQVVDAFKQSLSAFKSGLAVF